MQCHWTGEALYQMSAEHEACGRKPPSKRHLMGRDKAIRFEISRERMKARDVVDPTEILP